MAANLGYASPFRTGHARAAATYDSIALAARIEGATPHELVTILFNELLVALDGMQAALVDGDGGRRVRYQTRALSVLHGLETGLDFDAGGDLARQLASLYRQTRRIVMDPGEAPGLASIRNTIADVASAWAMIGRPA